MSSDDSHRMLGSSACSATTERPRGLVSGDGGGPPAPGCAPVSEANATSVAASAFMVLEFMARNTIEGNGKFPPAVRRRLAGSEHEIEFQMVSREGAVSSIR